MNDNNSIIIKYLSIGDLYNYLFINQTIKKKCIGELKTRLIRLKAEGDVKLAIKLSKLGFKIGLDLSYTNVVDVSELGGVHTLIYS